ncbi:hypothetical protein EVB32_070 [Rhizobium phage RHph_TM39]|uniref:Uncharacterized protein n=1 Tax=Rhizobium phage RHph_TM30 TaxID=2509764 RepID=A0A7S5R4V8_9CAUD|nr:hypothetical protein PQC16_gp070 [Rhizobium phage RHph_TM30]QIG71541.1 hypothetical protein EVB94_070 [Rhizobium phage RHph_TM40]QIG71904.1 hypothetical protein EVB95_070 [Rhizobium phage RHph_TM2_3B]QIG72266.1 hypothetical protein EVB96_070 [Rhizobium phage RHph_TM3_3_6]QIG77058.1 hypothetical protein EVB32_070 [Rhizobium phage RHph_TM39]QIG77657.1 hypothetical protein EVB64_070 [Rhizobium phage RHph_TM61]
MSKWNSLSGLIQTHGLKNLRFFFETTMPTKKFFGLVTISEPFSQRYVVEGRAIRSIKDGKIFLRTLDKKYASLNFHVSDLEMLSSSFPDRYYVMVGNVKYNLGEDLTLPVLEEA